MFFKNIFRKKHSKVNELETPLARCLNLFDLTLLTISGMIGSGIYVLTGVVAKEYTGPAIIVANLLAGLACLSGKNRHDISAINSIDSDFQVLVAMLNLLLEFLVQDLRTFSFTNRSVKSSHFSW